MSSGASPLLVQKPPDFVELFGRRLVRGKRLQDELCGGSIERAVEQIADQLPLGLIFCIRSLVDVGSLRLVPDDELLLRHDLKELENRRISGFTVQGFGHLANGAGTMGPQNAKDGELAIGRFPARGLHVRIVYDIFRSCQYESFRSVRTAAARARDRRAWRATTARPPQARRRRRAAPRRPRTPADWRR